MAPAQTLSWVIPLQTIAVVATLVGNSTEWQPKPKGNSDASTIETFVILCFIALGFGYWVGLTKSVEDAKCAGNLRFRGISKRGKTKVERLHLHPRQLEHIYYEIQIIYICTPSSLWSS
jgi:hypothetical protein